MPKRVVRRRDGDRAAAIDTEATGTNVWTGARPFAVSMCDYEGNTRWWEWTVDPRTRKPRVRDRDRREITAEIARFDWLDFWNAKFDWLMLDSVGIEVPIGKVREVSFMARAVNNLEFSYELKPLAKKYGEFDNQDEKELHDEVVKCRRLAKRLGWSIGQEVEQDYWLPATLWALEPALAREAGVRRDVCEKYGVRDAERTAVLSAVYRHAMDDLDVREAYEKEMELWPTTLEMEQHGVRIDPERMERCREECEEVVRRSTAALAEASGNPDFNVNSPTQVAELLFGGRPLRLPVLKRTATRSERWPAGQPRTNAEALAPHKANPIVEHVFRVRSNANALKNFFNKYPRLATPDPKQGLILHPGYKQWGTLTSRYSCTEPNLMAVSDPDTTNSLAAEYVVDIRQIFMVREGCVWYCPDYSQVEVVIFADIAGEPTMLDAIRNGQDIHGATVEKVWSGRDNPRAVPAAMEVLETRDAGLARAKLEEFGWSIGALEKSVDKKTFRKKAKSVTFTKIFGGTFLALMRWISVDKPTAVRILGEYDDSFPLMVQKMKEIEAQGKKDGYVINPFGLRLAVDPWNAYRAVNHVVQSSAAILMKNGMRKCAAYLKQLGIDARIIMTIHDELIFEFRKGHNYRHVLRGIVQRMGDHGGVFSVPIKVDMDKVTERWSDKVKVEL